MQLYWCNDIVYVFILRGHLWSTVMQKISTVETLSVLLVPHIAYRTDPQIMVVAAQFKYRWLRGEPTDEISDESNAYFLTLPVTSFAGKKNTLGSVQSTQRNDVQSLRWSSWILIEIINASDKRVCPMICGVPIVTTWIHICSGYHQIT